VQNITTTFSGGTSPPPKTGHTSSSPTLIRPETHAHWHGSAAIHPLQHLCPSRLLRVNAELVVCGVCGTPLLMFRGHGHGGRDKVVQAYNVVITIYKLRRFTFLSKASSSQRTLRAGLDLPSSVASPPGGSTTSSNRSFGAKLSLCLFPCHCHRSCHSG
jgi:hypothetical protein